MKPQDAVLQASSNMVWRYVRDAGAAGVQSRAAVEHFAGRLSAANVRNTLCILKAGGYVAHAGYGAPYCVSAACKLPAGESRNPGADEQAAAEGCADAASRSDDGWSGAVWAFGPRVIAA